MRSERSGAGRIDAWLADLGGWRAETLGRVRDLIREAVPDVVEEIKWRKPSNDMAGVPVWSLDGVITTGEPYKDKVKLAFAYGARFDDPHGLFNAGFGGNTRRAIDLFEGDDLDPEAFVALVRAAASYNREQRG